MDCRRGHQPGQDAVRAEGRLTPISFDVIGPCDYLNLNHRAHWTKRSTDTRLWREATAWAARRAKLPRLQKARIVVTFHFKDRRERDVHNLMPTAKAAIDGAVGDYGLLPRDSTAYLTGPDLRVADQLQPKDAKPRITITIYPESEAA